MIAAVLLPLCGVAFAPSHAAARSVPRSTPAWSHLPPPPLMTGIGNASMKITTASPEAQAFFNQGLRLLHGFWFFEAYRAFQEAARRDPSAAMPYWGMAEALMNFEMDDQAKEAIEKAESLMGRAGEHERYYIRAMADLVERPGDEGRNAHLIELRALVNKYPEDLNAQAFLALFEMSGYGPDGRPNPGQTAAQRLLRHILASHPDDVAANHYWIHAVEDGPRPQEGLKCAELLAQLAPNSGHLVHMAGHVYYRLGDYEKARQAFLRSMRVDEAYLAREHLSPEDDVNYQHNLSYLVATCAEEGRYQEALKWAKRLDDLPAPPDYASSALHYAIPVGSTLLRLHLRFADWRAAAADPIDFGVDPTSVGPPAREYEEGWHIYAAGMAALAKGSGKADVDQAGKQSEALQALLGRLSEQQSAEPPSSAFWVGGAIRLLELASIELQGNLESIQGRNAEAFRLLKEAAEKQKALGYTEPPYYARPVEETLGGALLRAHAWVLARQAFDQEIQTRPHSGFALFGIAQSYELEGRAQEATHAYTVFLEAWRDADRDLRPVQKAESWVAAHGTEGPRTR